MSPPLVTRRQDWIVSAGLHALVLGSAALLSLSPPAEPVHRLDLPLHWSEVEPAAAEAPPAPRPPAPTPKPAQSPTTRPTAATRSEPPSPVVPETTPLPRELAPAAEPYAATANPEAQAVSPATPQPTGSSPTASTAPAVASTDPATERRWQAQLEVLLARDRHYPMQARRAGQEGTVTVEAHFAADGQLLRCVVQLGSGFRALDEAAIAMVHRAADAARALIHPGRSTRLRIPITFHLEES